MGTKTFFGYANETAWMSRCWPPLRRQAWISLLSERLSVMDVVKLTGLDQSAVRRPRQTKAVLEDVATSPNPSAAEG